MEEFGSGGGLEQVGRSARAECFSRQLGVLIHGQVDQLELRQDLLEALAGVQAVHDGHANIKDDDIRLKLWRCLDQEMTVGEHRHHFEFWFKQVLNRIRQQGMIICEYDPRSFHGSFMRSLNRREIAAVCYKTSLSSETVPSCLVRGMDTFTCVPREGCE